MITTKLEMTEEELHTRGGVLDRLIAIAFDSCILLDANGILIHAAHNSDSRSRWHENYIGKHITEASPYAYFAIDTLKTHKGHWAVTEVVQERKCLVNIFPIFCKGKFIGLLGTVLHSGIESLSKILMQLQGSTHAGDTERIFNVVAKMGSNRTFDDFIGESPQNKAVIAQGRRAATSNLPVLILGESGTGKEILANAIHSATVDRTWNPFIRLNCSAIPKDLAESEFFGHEKGAFTSASSAKKGKFELAAGGSIFLDEIGDMDYNLQSKLLRVLEEKEFERVGGVQLMPMTARVISATNSDLHRKSREGSFRSDLYYRLSAIEIEVPPLRERIEDIPLLADHYISKDTLDITLDRSARDAMQAHSWPGNVRELRNVLNRLGLFHHGKAISAAIVRTYLRDGSLSGPVTAASGQNHSAEYTRLVEALKTTGFNLPAAAEKLGVCRATLYNMMNRHGVKRKMSLRE